MIKYVQRGGDNANDICGRPKFMALQSDWEVMGSEVYRSHEYDLPEDPKKIILALQWMLDYYRDVEVEHGEDYGVPYARMIGRVKG